MVSESISGIDIYNKLEIKGTKRWKKDPPDVCPYCSTYDSVCGIEVIAAYNGVLFWECEHCNEKMLRFTKQTTVKHLAKTSDLYIDLEGLETIWESEPN
jgi:DNA-directed RNA polymerase subunit RPC12/RpoP